MFSSCDVDGYRVTNWETNFTKERIVETELVSSCFGGCVTVQNSVAAAPCKQQQHLSLGNLKTFS